MTRWCIKRLIGLAITMAALMALRSQAGMAQESKKAVTLRLATPQENETEVGLLTRELVRQAFLIAARDEMGLPTRDATLREDLRDAQTEGSPFEIAVIADADQEILAKISKSGQNPMLLKAFRLQTPADRGTIVSLATQLEELSRTEFVPVLTDANCKSREIKPAASAQIPNVAMELLSRLNSLSQFNAVRQIHSTIRNSGESSDLLIGLARAYANLGAYSQFHWSPAHQVFKARALLYAERLNVKYPSDAALKARAYVRALVGLHQAALNDLVGAKQLQNDPEAEVIRAFCRGESAVLAKSIEDGSQKVLASYLAFLALEPTDIYELRLNSVETLLKNAPECLEAMDALAEDGPLGIHNAISTNAPIRFTKTLSSDIAQIPDLPPAVQKLASTPIPPQDFSARSAFVQALWSAGRAGNDVSEPSLTVAGNLIQEVCFVHLWRRIDLERNKYGWNSSDTLERGRIVVKGHPYAAFLEGHHATPNVARGAIQTLTTLAVQNPNLELVESPILTLLGRYENRIWPTLRAKMVIRSDFVYRDQVKIANMGLRDEIAQEASRKLTELSPFLPATIAANIIFDWDRATERVTDWEKAYGEEPLVQEAFSRQYQALDRPEDAERWLQRRIRTLPDQHSYSALAAFYLGRGDHEKWSQTLLDSLDLENHGLGEAQARVELAKYFMVKKEFEKGVEHADKAATSEASWALLCAAECHEQIKDWDGAEEFIKRNAKHYNDTAAASWYFWCRRTGHGDIEAARELAQPSLKEQEQSSQAEEKAHAALYYYAEDNKPRALALLKDAFTLNRNNILVAVRASLIADELGDSKLRDLLLDQALGSARAASYPMGALLHDFRNALRPVDAIPFDVKVNAWRIKLTMGTDVLLWNSFIGQFLVLRGQVDDAIPFLQAAATSHLQDQDDCIYAGIALTRQNIEHEPVRPYSLLDPDTRYQNAISSVYLMSKGRNLEGAREQLKIATELRPDSFDVLFVTSLFDAVSGKRDEALQAMSHCIDQMPAATDLLVIRAKWYELLHNYPDAIRDYEKIIELDPTNATAHCMLASILSTCEIDQFRDGKRALELARKSLEGDTEIPEFYRKIGVATALAETGDFAGAIKALDDGFKMAPPQFQKSYKGMQDSFRKNQPIRRPAKE